MEVKTQIFQNLKFKGGGDLKDVECHFINGIFKWMRFNLGVSSTFLIETNLEELEELRKILDDIINFGKEEKPKVEKRLDGRLLRPEPVVEERQKFMKKPGDKIRDGQPDVIDINDANTQDWLKKLRGV
jgi:hypothetical protein